MLPMITVSCGSDSGGDLFVGGKPKPDASNSGGTSATGGASGAGARGGSSGAGAGGSGARSGGTAGTDGGRDASAGTSGTGTAGTNGASGAGATGGTAGTAGAAGTAGIGGTTGTSGGSGTNGRAGSGAVDGSAGTTGASGSAGSAGSNGSAGTGGTAGADAGSDAGDAGPKSCTNSSQCKSDEFCSKPSCAENSTGECKPRPKNCMSTESPVCGCNAVNYWNDCLRQQAGIASGTSGECLTSASCGGLPGFTCPDGRARCAHLVTELECGTSDAFGTCWVIPEQCPQIVVGASYRACSGGTDRCVSKCEAIKAEHDYFTDSTCPQ
jgi:hypothetical protein